MQEIKELNNLLSKLVDQGLYPGFQWQINIKNELFAGKYGFKNIENKDPILENTIYRIWSMTKPVVAVAALQFIQQDKISLDDPISKYLTEFSNLKVLKNNNSPIYEVTDLEIEPTIQHLLLHTAGFSYNFLGDTVAKKYDDIKLFHSGVTTLEEEIKNLAEVPLLFQPGERWVYSVSMDVLGRILEVVGNDSLQNILQENIFNPLEMYETAFSISDKAEARVMSTYEFDSIKSELKNEILGPQKIRNYQYPFNEINYARGGHGLFSTISDYAKFAEMLRSGKSKKGKTLVDSNSLSLMTKNAIDSHLFPLEILTFGTIKDDKYVNDLEGYGWGHGFRTLMDPLKNSKLGSIGEFGWAGAAATYFLVDNSKEMTAILMTQVLDAEDDLKRNFYKFIYSNL